MKRHLLPAIFAALFVTPVSAISYTWNGAGADNNISTAGNWISGPPASDILNTDLIFGGLTRLTPNFTSIFSANSVTFNNTAGAFTVGGSRLNIGAGGIVNNDSQVQTFNNIVALNQPTSLFNAATGSLAFNGSVLLGGGVLTLVGSNAITIGGGITNTGTINKGNAGLFTINAFASNITGNLNLTAGSTIIAATGATQVFSGTFGGGNVTLGGGSLAINENTTFDAGAQLVRNSGNLTIASGKTLTAQGGSDIVLGSSYSIANGNIVATGAGSTFQVIASSLVNSGGSLSILNGASGLIGSYIDVGIGSTGNLTVSGTGSSFSMAVSSFWGDGGTANVTFSTNAAATLAQLDIARSNGSIANIQVLSGADVTSGTITMGNHSNIATGDILVSGAGSTWTQNGTGNLSLGGNAVPPSYHTLTIGTGGVFSTGTGSTTVNSSGRIHIYGGTFQANGNVVVNGGLISRGTGGLLNLGAGKSLTVQAGGQFLDTSSSELEFGGASTISLAGASILLKNSGSISVNQGAEIVINTAAELVTTNNTLNIGMLGDGTVSLSGGGSFLSAGLTYVGASSLGEGILRFANGSDGSVNSLNVATFGTGAQGTVEILSGSLLSAGGLFVGTATTDSYGTVDISGSSSSLQLSGAAQTTIGATAGNGSGLMNVLNNSNFQSGTGSILIQKTGVVTVSGNSAFNASGNMTISGQVNVTNDGLLSVASGKFLMIQDGGDFYTDSSISFGGSIATVTGVGSTLEAESGLIFFGNQLHVLNGGSVSAGANFNFSNNGSAVLASGVGSTISVSGTSTWGEGTGTTNLTFSQGASFVGNGVFVGTGDSTVNVDVLSGADMSTGMLSIGGIFGVSNSVVTVSGQGSNWTQSGASTTNIGLPVLGSAELNIEDGGIFTSGTGQFSLGSSGVINVSGGTLTINGQFVKSGGALNFTSGVLRLIHATSNLTIGSGGLLGANLTLNNDRFLEIGGTTTIDAFRTLTIDGGGLTTNSLVTNGSLDFRRGSLVITGDDGLEIGNGALGADVVLSSGAALQVTQDTVIAEGATLQTDGGSFTTGVLSNSGLVEHTRGSFTMLNGGVNNAGADLFIQRILTTNGVLNNVGGGQIVLTNGTGRISGSGSVSNSGLIRGDGTIATALTNAPTGVIRAEAGKTLRVNGAFANNAGTLSLEGGTLEFAGGVVNSNTGFISGRGALNAALLTNNGVMAFSAGNTDIRGDVTNASGARIVTSGAGSTTTFYDDVVHNGTEIFTSAGANTVFFGSQSGAGNFTGTGTVHYIGDLRPGNSPAKVTYGGDVMLSSTTTLTMELGGLTAGVNYDQLAVAGSLLLDGALTISLINGFVPALGNVFQIFDAETITGAFDSIQLPNIAGYLAWNTSSLHSTGEISVINNLTPIQSWRLFYFSNSANIGDGADNNDFDKDGIPNLMEYALGLDPLIASTAGQPTLGFHEDGPLRYITLTITRPLAATDVNYRVEVGPSPASFSAGSYYSSGGDVPTNTHTTQVSRTDDGVMETIIVRDNTELSTASARFLRLKVENPAEPE